MNAARKTGKGDVVLRRMRDLNYGDIFLAGNNRIYKLLSSSGEKTQYAEEIDGYGHVWMFTDTDADRDVLVLNDISSQE